MIEGLEMSKRAVFVQIKGLKEAHVPPHLRSGCGVEILGVGFEVSGFGSRF
jgi:hypothetical protein